MPVNFYFNNFNSASEQRLLEDLTVESIKQYGLDLYYIPRTLQAEDDILNEDDLSTFDSAHLIEMYVVNVDGFGGEGDFLSKFGLEIRDSISLAMSRRSFSQYIGDGMNMPRPREGDLVYLPLNKKIFRVMHVEHERTFYQLGALQFYELRLELFEYSGERFRTGVEEIDLRFTDVDMTSNEAFIDPEVADPVAQNIDIQDYANTIIDFSEADPYSSGGKW